MKNQFIFTDSLKKEKEVFKSFKPAKHYVLSLQDKRRKDKETVYTEYTVSKEMYQYYFTHFMRLWGKKITFESLDGTIANGFLNALKTR